MKRVAGVVWLFLLTGAVSACSSYSFEYEPVYNVDGTRQMYSAENFHQRGIAHLRNGRIGLALQDLRRALSKTPESVKTLNAIAVSYDQLRRYDVSRTYYERSLAVEPHSIQTLNNLAQSLLRQGKPEQALAYLEMAQRLVDANQVVNENLKIARWQKQKLEQNPEGAAKGQENAERRKATSWVERTSTSTQTLVTLPLLGREEGAAFTRAESRKGGGEGSDAYTTDAVYSKSRSGTRIEVEDLTDVAWKPEANGHSPKNGKSPAPRNGAQLEHVRIEVSNGAGRRHMAKRMAQYLEERGFAMPRLTNADRFSYQHSVVFYQPGFESAARSIATSLPVAVSIAEQREQRDHIRLRLGGDLLDFDASFLIASKGF